MGHSNLTKKSKYLSLILRHDPGKAGIILDKNGWASVFDICRKLPISKAELDEIVSSDEKGRYSYSEDGLKIRANQGHSIDVDVELTETQPPDILYHGTGRDSLDSIFEGGLMSMSRQYVHLSSDAKTAFSVGSRHGKPVVLRINSKEMFNDGHVFWLSKNGVWLAKSVPKKYISYEMYSY